MTTYVWRDGRFIDKATGEPMQVRDENAICRPFVMSDIPEYLSPIDGKPITSRSQRREDLRKNGCVELDPPKSRALKNKRFAAKRGLSTDDALKRSDFLR